MPPKPPIRIPVNPASATKSKFLPSTKAVPRAPPRAPPAPLSQSTPSPSSKPPRWLQNSKLRSSARYATWSANVVVLLCGLVWVRDHYVNLDRVRGSSMAPTLSPLAHETGKMDWVVMRPYMERAAKRRTANPGTGDGESDEDSAWGVKRGDIVTFWKPHKPEEMGIKRVVAVGGDTVYPKRGYALDPKSHTDRLQGMPDGLPDPDPESILGDKIELGKVVVPYGHVWVEGDNWRNSYDSNDFGPISKGLIEGKALWIWRSWMKFLEVGDGRDKREKNKRSRVVHGKSEIPAVFLE